MKHLVLAFALATLPSLAFAGTPLENWEKKVEKVTRSGSDAKRFTKPKALCVCLANDPALNRAVGVVTSSEFVFGATRLVRVQCTVPLFETNGDSQGASGCLDWMPLSK